MYGTGTGTDAGTGATHVVVSEADLLPKEESRDSDPDRCTQLRRLPDLAEAGALTAEELMTSPALTTRPDASSPRPPAPWHGPRSSGCRWSTGWSGQARGTRP